MDIAARSDLEFVAHAAEGFGFAQGRVLVEWSVCGSLIVSGGAAEQRVQGLQPKDLSAKDVAEVAGDALGDGVDDRRLLITEFGGYAGDRLVGNAAGDDELEEIEVGIEVKREAMRGDAARDVNADSSNLSAGGSAGPVWGSSLRPNAGASGDALGGDAEISADADQRLFELADEIYGSDFGSESA